MRALAIAALTACGSAPAPAPPPTAPDSPSVTRPRIVAHRGASHDAPENTLSAFRRAWELGVECVELDVHVTRDGHVVVMHDATTKRIGDRDRRISDQTLAELRELDVGGWKSPAYKGERIPTLGDVLTAMPNGRTTFVEIKSGPDTVGAVAAAIKSANLGSRDAHVALQSFDAPTLVALAAAVPEAPAYWTVDPPIDDRDPSTPRALPYTTAVIDEAKRNGFPGVALLYSAVTDDLLVAAEAAGISVDVWTINDAPVIGQWQKRGVRWIETDRPDLVPAD
jgi:glycerophosphoryl diester phosphodiesterase